MKIDIKNKLTGAVLWSHAAVGNTVTVTLEAAAKAGANLAFASLNRANLDRANLADVYLAGANLAGASLNRANLAFANLDGANLVGANLTGAKIRDEITVRRAPLHISGLKWPVTVWDHHMRIGCQFHSIAEWAGFSDNVIAEMHPGALTWWQQFKPALLAMAAAEGRG